MTKPKKDKPICDESDNCKVIADWVRHTQFAGDHYFCTDHAKKQKGFNKVDNFGFNPWEKL